MPTLTTLFVRYTGEMVITPSGEDLLEDPIVTQLFKIFLAFY